MITLVAPPHITDKLTTALTRAGRREVGGVLMAEHVGPNEFHLAELSIQRRGSVTHFVRKLGTALRKINKFFRRTNKHYARFNYIGEWHSHPSFAPEPSVTDHKSMLEIITDPAVGANFVVLLIVKLDDTGAIVGTAHSYLPSGLVHQSNVVFRNA